ncbi:hypothetical protein GCM10009760_14420 [Kitasatospora kazusensis]|uniref:Uncharacterized protein n=1 Tax=Kitasatospora kazusensis TaxID=407974 RepID=A0ABN2Z297_9ACTN
MPRVRALLRITARITVRPRVRTCHLLTSDLLISGPLVPDSRVAERIGRQGPPPFLRHTAGVY